MACRLAVPRQHSVNMHIGDWSVINVRCVMDEVLRMFSGQAACGITRLGIVCGGRAVCWWADGLSSPPFPPTPGLFPFFTPCPFFHLGKHHEVHPDITPWKHLPLRSTPGITLRNTPGVKGDSYAAQVAHPGGGPGRPTCARMSECVRTARKRMKKAGNLRRIAAPGLLPP